MYRLVTSRVNIAQRDEFEEEDPLFMRTSKRLTELM